jgi:chemotaxis response regulator CheB
MTGRRIRFYDDSQAHPADRSRTASDRARALGFAGHGRYLIRQENHGRRVLHAALHFQPDLILLDAAPEHLELAEIAQQIHADKSLRMCRLSA